jgi:hypothetical protein
MAAHRKAVNLGNDRGDYQLLGFLGEVRQDLVEALELARYIITNEIEAIR